MELFLFLNSNHSHSYFIDNKIAKAKYSNYRHATKFKKQISYNYTSMSKVSPQPAVYGDYVLNLLLRTDSYPTVEPVILPILPLKQKHII